MPAVAAATLDGRPSASFFAIPSDRKIVAFVNVDVIPLEMFAKIKFPVEVTLCPIRVPEGQTINDVIRIYDVGTH
jgi:hypothetical protein